MVVQRRPLSASAGAPFRQRIRPVILPMVDSAAANREEDHHRHDRDNSHDGAGI
jgi:uncharacterized membrane protein